MVGFLGWFELPIVIPGRVKREPESITTIREYGFRACRLRSAIADRRRIPE
jgi:hypothetical protein